MLKKLFSLFSCALAFAATLMAQAPTPSQQPAAAIRSLSASQFDSLLADTSVVLLDVRTVAEYDQYHIANARNIVWGPAFVQDFTRANFAKGTRFAVYCRSGRRSKAAAQQMAAYGYTVFDLDKGILDWQRAGKPVVK